MYQGKTNAMANAKCPYFDHEYRKSITCEGLLDASTFTLHRFDTEEEKDLYLKDCCFRYPNSCIQAVTLDRKYGVGK